MLKNDHCSQSILVSHVKIFAWMYYRERKKRNSRNIRPNQQQYRALLIRIMTIVCNATLLKCKLNWNWMQGLTHFVCIFEKIIHKRNGNTWNSIAFTRVRNWCVRVCVYAVWRAQTAFPETAVTNGIDLNSGAQSQWHEDKSTHQHIYTKWKWNCTSKHIWQWVCRVKNALNTNEPKKK